MAKFWSNHQKSIGISPKEAQHIPHLAPDTVPIPEALAALVLTPELLLLGLLALREPRTLSSSHS